MIKVYENFVNDFLYQNTNNIMVFLGNHDTNRINEIYNGNLDKYKLGLTLITTIRGIPQIYYGDEIGMTGNKDINGDGDIRKDFPGGWNNDKNNAFTQKGRTETQNKFFNFSKKLLNWRKTSPVIHKGKTLHFIPVNNVYVYFRYTENETVMVILNNNPKKQTINLKRFKEILQNAKSGREILSNKQIVLYKPLTINGKTPMVIEIKK